MQKNKDQVSFLLHHLLTIGLVAGAFKYGLWRGAVLTRVIHDPADIFLYGSKFYQGLYDQGRGTWTILSVLYILNNVVWGSTRVLLYGWFMICITGTLQLAWNHIHGIVFVAFMGLYVGSALMWLLQLIWFVALVFATIKFFRSGKIDKKDILDVGQPEQQKNGSVPLLQNQVVHPS